MAAEEEEEGGEKDEGEGEGEASIGWAASITSSAPASFPAPCIARNKGSPGICTESSKSPLSPVGKSGGEWK